MIDKDSEIHSQLTLLIEKLNTVSPEFKALMEAYINKANEAEESKINLENTISKYEELRAEIVHIRETNRNLTFELQSTRETLNKLEQELNTFQAISTKNEEVYKDKTENLNKQNLEYENKIKRLEEEKTQIKQILETKISKLLETEENLRRELVEQKFNFRQSLQELILERDSFKKQVEQYEVILNEQFEQVELRSKEIEYKNAILNQLIKHATTERLRADGSHTDHKVEKQGKRPKNWFFKQST